MDSSLRFVTENHVIWLASAQEYREILCYDYDITLPMPGLRNTILATILVKLQPSGKAIVHASDSYYKNTAFLHMVVLNTRIINACLKQIVGDHPQIQKLQIQLVDNDIERRELLLQLPAETEIPSLYDVYMGSIDTERDPRIRILCDKLYLPDPP